MPPPWPLTYRQAGYVTTYESVQGRGVRDIEDRLGFTPGSLNAGYAIYDVAESIEIGDFLWRDVTRFADGWQSDPDIDASGPPFAGLKAQRFDEKRAELGKRLNYDEKKVDAELASLMNNARARLNVRQGPQRIVKVIAVRPGQDYPDSRYANIPQWKLIKPKTLRLFHVVFDQVTTERLSGAAWWHANQAKYPNSANVADLRGTFAQSVRDFIVALRRAGASVRVSATLRSQARAELMLYCFQIARGRLDPHHVPQIAGCDIVWDHGLPPLSRQAAQEMVQLFQVVYQPSLKSLHIAGKAIDMDISWSTAIRVADRAGKLHLIPGPGNGADSAPLHAVGKSYGVVKLLSDRPHWSINGH